LVGFTKTRWCSPPPPPPPPTPGWGGGFPPPPLGSPRKNQPGGWGGCEHFPWGGAWARLPPKVHAKKKNKKIKRGFPKPKKVKKAVSPPPPTSRLNPHEMEPRGAGVFPLFPSEFSHFQKQHELLKKEKTQIPFPPVALGAPVFPPPPPPLWSPPPGGLIT